MVGLFRREIEETSLKRKNVDDEMDENAGKEIEMTEDNITNLTSDTEFKGTIKFEKALKIDGKFEGEMVTEEGEVIVGNTGSVKANVKVKNAIVEGQIDGNIIASERVELRKKAKLIGDLKAKTVVIDEGVVFIGKCNVHPEGFKLEKNNAKEKEQARSAN